MSLTDTILSMGGPPVEAYYCDDTYTNNQASLRQINLLYTYEMVHTCAGDSMQRGIEFIEQEMLELARQTYMPDPNLCKVPQEFWFAYLSRAPADYVTNLECTDFPDLVDGQCCSVIQGNMTFMELSQANMDDMETWTKTKLEIGSSPASFGDGTNTWLTRYYGAASGFVPTTTTTTAPTTTTAASSGDDDDDDNATTNSNVGALQGEPYIAPSDTNNWNWMSIVMLCFLVLCVFGFIAFLVHRRYQRRKNIDQYSLGKHKSLEDDDIEESVESSSAAWMTPRKVPYPYGDIEGNPGRRIPSTAQESYEVHVVGDVGHQDSTLEIQAISAQPFCGVDDCHIITPSAHQGYGNEEEEPPTANAQVLRYSPAGRTGFQNEFDGSEEADSWAQSQGSVGSLGNNGI